MLLTGWFCAHLKRKNRYASSGVELRQVAIQIARKNSIKKITVRCNQYVDLTKFCIKENKIKSYLQTWLDLHICGPNVKIYA